MNKNEISLAVNLGTLRRLDPAVSDIVDRATHVVVYLFDEDEKNWSKRNVEGTLFIVKRVQEPLFAIVILNRLEPENLISYLGHGTQFEIRSTFITFRDTQGTTLGFWFHSEEDAQRVGRLFSLYCGHQGSRSHTTDMASVATSSLRGMLFPQASVPVPAAHPSPSLQHQQPRPLGPHYSMPVQDYSRPAPMASHVNPDQVLKQLLMPHAAHSTPVPLAGGSMPPAPQQFRHQPEHPSQQFQFVSLPPQPDARQIHSPATVAPVPSTFPPTEAGNDALLRLIRGEPPVVQAQPSRPISYATAGPSADVTVKDLLTNAMGSLLVSAPPHKRPNPNLQQQPSLSSMFKPMESMSYPTPQQQPPPRSPSPTNAMPNPIPATSADGRGGTVKKEPAAARPLGGGIVPSQVLRHRANKQHRPDATQPPQPIGGHPARPPSVPMPAATPAAAPMLKNEFIAWFIGELQSNPRLQEELYQHYSVLLMNNTK